MNVSVYVAAKSELRAEAAACAEMLRHRGVTVVSTWHDDPRFLPMSSEEFRAPGRILAQVEATRDVIQILNCDVLVHLTPRIDDPNRFNTTGGNLVELGIAIGLGKRCIYVGAPLCVFHDLPGVVQVHNPLDLCDAVFGGRLA